MIMPSFITTPASPRAPIREGILMFIPIIQCPPRIPSIEKGITDISKKVSLNELKR